MKTNPCLAHLLVMMALLLIAPSGLTQQHVVQLGPRPYFLISQLANSDLKKQLAQCENMSFSKKEFSIGHRGAALMFPEHTRESYEAAARMGAGIIECDVTFTKDKELVCRHAQNDLHTTTNILLTPLASKCTRPFKPYDPAHNLAADAECRTSDITLAEFKTLRGKMDGFNPRALTPEEYVNGTPPWRTDLYSGATSGTLVSHKESIQIFKQLGVKMIPELKEAVVPMPFDGMTQQDYAQKLIDEYKLLRIPASNVYLQSFHWKDIQYWLKHEPLFAKQAILLESAESIQDLMDPTTLKNQRSQGLRWVGAPIFSLIQISGDDFAPSEYAKELISNGFGIIAWTLERSGTLTGQDKGGWYYQSVQSKITGPGDTYVVLDLLAQKVGVSGVFSDWPATTTYYANCLNLR